MPELQGRMDAFLRPASIAIVGAGDRPTSSGGALLRNLETCRWPGRVVPVNPKGGIIRGLPAVRSLSELDVPVDLVAVLVKPESILSVVEEAARTGHRNLLILPGGFAEAGASGMGRDQALRALAERENLLVGGPNCAGLINLLDASRPFAATFFRDLPRGGPVALISQSGAIAEELIAASHEMRLPIGATISVGNGMHLDLTAYLDYLGEDAACKAVLLYAESFGDAGRFADVARRVAARKPVVALIGGRTRQGRDAASRHTGSMPMSAAEADAFCRECGIVRVNSLRALKIAAKAFGALPEGIGQRVVLLSNSGGPGVLAADRAVDAGLELIDLPGEAAATLLAALPPEAAVANPMDLLADAREDRFAASLDVLLGAVRNELDALLMIHVVPFMVEATPIVELLAERARSAGIPMMHSMLGTREHRTEWFDRMEASGLPVFSDCEEMCEAAGMLAHYRRLREVLSGRRELQASKGNG
ncbi:MAG: CoA-binding protein [Betaproteobacteria bacterium]|nr:CoA-binding protein [Betaproteobacteria bacterium]